MLEMKYEISVEIALDRLKKAGLEMKRQGLTRYLRTGEIVGVPPRPEYPKEGWKVDPVSLDEFISLKTMNVNELRLLVKQLRQEIKVLKGEVKVEEKTEIPGQLTIDEIGDEHGLVALEISKTDINRLKKAKPAQKQALRDELFANVEPGKKAVVKAPEGVTAEQYLRVRVDFELAELG